MIWNIFYLIIRKLDRLYLFIIITINLRIKDNNYKIK